MLHEWNPHCLPDLVQCRHCRAIRYKADKVTECWNISRGMNNGKSNPLTINFKLDLKHYRDRKYPCLYVYSNNGCYTIIDGVLKAAWTLIHPQCTHERNVQIIAVEQHAYPEDPQEPDDEFDNEEGEENSL